MAALTAYQLMRKANLGENKALLAQHGVLPPVLVPESVIRPASPEKVKVKRYVRKRSARVESPEPKRFSLRVRLQPSKSEDDVDEDWYQSLSESDNDSDYENEDKRKTKTKTNNGLLKLTEEERKYLRNPTKPLFVRPNTYGSIKGIRVGHWWELRLGCSHDGIHRPTVAGIHFGPEGAYSVALSGGYDDDVDNGDTFTYTGEGGRDLKGTKANPKNLRTAAQSKDQTLTRGNLALSVNSKNGYPVRVIRGYKLPGAYAPEKGYRYDGLYKVTDFWLANGESGFKVYKFTFERCDEEPAPWHDNFDKNPSLMELDSTVEPWCGWPPEASVPRTDILHIKCEKTVFKAQLVRDDWFLFNYDQEPPSPSYYLRNEDEQGQDNSEDGWSGWPSQVSVSGTDIFHIECGGYMQRVKLTGDKWQTIHDDPSSPIATRNEDLGTEP